jgi:16S rRNA (guanine527-N7)-methyltransferase
MARLETQQILEEGLSALSRSWHPDQVLALSELAELLELWSARMNLTSHRSASAIARRLVLDAAALLGELPPFTRLADLGSGAGFPGLPLAILEPDREFVLVEARERRHHFQREAIRRLGLKHVQPLRGRIESLEPIRCTVVVAQALGPPDRIVDAMLRWVEPGGTLVIPGGGAVPDPPLDDRLRDIRTGSYQVPLAGPARSFWMATRA